MEVFAEGPFLVMQIFIPVVHKVGQASLACHGFIWVITSPRGLCAWRQMPPAVQFTADVIRVNSVNPGTMPAMKTAMLSGGLEACRMRAAAIAARHEGNCQGVAYVMLLLASDEAS